MKGKKILLIGFMACFAICASAFALFGCNGGKSACKHTSVEHKVAKAADCTTAGNAEYWYCGDCQKYFSNAALTTETTLTAVTIAANGHNETRVEAKAADCTTAGNREYWYCGDCQKYFSNAALTTETTLSAVTIDANGHNETRVEAKAADCTTAGNTEYWFCDDCDTYFADAELTTETTLVAVTIDASHAYGEFVYDYTENKYVKTCSRDETHTFEQAAGTEEFPYQTGTEDYPYLVKNGTQLNQVVAFGGYIKLTDNVSDTTIVPTQNIVIDLNGKQLASAATNTSVVVNIKANLGLTVEIKNGTIKNNSTNVKSTQCINIGYNSSKAVASTLILDSVTFISQSRTGENGGDGDKAVILGDYSTATITNCTFNNLASGVIVWKEVNVTITDCTFNDMLYYGVSGSGDKYGTNPVIELNNCTITSRITGVYHPQMGGQLTVNGGTITGVHSAIEVRAGTVEIKGGAKLESTATENEASANGSGTTIKGAALAVSQHTTDSTITVTITNSTLKGVYAIYEEDLQNDTARDKISITVDNTCTLTGQVYSQNCTGLPESA